DICSSSAPGVDCSACVEKFSRSENRMVRLRLSTPRASGIPDLIRPLTTSTGANEENDWSELRSGEAADWSCAISRILEGRFAGCSKDKLSTDLSSCEMFSIGFDRRRDRR